MERIPHRLLKANWTPKTFIMWTEYTDSKFKWQDSEPLSARYTLHVQVHGYTPNIYNTQVLSCSFTNRVSQEVHLGFKRYVIRLSSTFLNVHLQIWRLTILPSPDLVFSPIIKKSSSHSFPIISEVKLKALQALTNVNQYLKTLQCSFGCTELHQWGTKSTSTPTWGKKNSG